MITKHPHSHNLGVDEDGTLVMYIELINQNEYHPYRGWVAFEAVEDVLRCLHKRKPKEKEKIKGEFWEPVYGDKLFVG